MSNDLSPGGASSLNAAQILAKLTGATALAAGAMLFGSGSALLTTLPASTNGYLLSLVAGAPAWVPSPSAALPASYVVGDTLYASSTSALSRLAAVAVGQALVSNGVGVAPSWSASPLFTGIVTAKPTTTAGIALDPNAATGNFTLSLSPATLTAARRWTYPDRSDTVAGLGAQIFTGAQVMSATLNVGSTTIIGTDPGGSELLRSPSLRAGSLTINATQIDTPAANAYDVIALNYVGYASGITQFRGVDIYNGKQSLMWSVNGSSGLIRSSVSQYTGQLTSTADRVCGVETASGFTPRFRMERNSIALWDSSVNASGSYEIIQATPRLTISIGGTVTIPGTLSSGQLTATGVLSTLGTITTAQQAIDSSVTWNSGATAFTGWKLNVTDTASAAGSLLLDLQVGGVSKFSVRKDGLGLLTLGGLAYAGANNGELWHDSTQKNLSCYVAGIRNSLVGCIFTSGQKVISGTSETTMFASGTGTPTLPANSMVAGKMVRIRIKGYISTTGTYTLRIRVSIGGLMMDTSAVTLPFGTVTQEGFSLEADFLMVTPGAASTWMCAMMMQIGNGTTAYRIAQSPGSASNDTTISNAIDVTAQWGTSANFIVKTASVEILN